MGKGKRELKKTKNQQKSTKMEKENNKKAHSQTSINVIKAESHKLESKDKDQEIPKDRNYTKAYNITYISTTAFMLLGAFSGAIVLYIYLNSINSTSLFYKSISGTNLISFIAAYLVLNSFTFFITTSPSYLVYKNEIKSGICAYSLPTLVSFIFICCYCTFSFFGRESWYIENTQIILCVIAIILFLSYFFVLKNTTPKKELKILITRTKRYKILISKKSSSCLCSCIKITLHLTKNIFTKHFINNFEKITYFVLSAGYSILFILGIKHGEHDFFYITYSILIPALVWINNTIVSDINKNTYTKKSLFQFVFFSFITSTILMPIFIYSIVQAVKLSFLPNLETKYSDKIMQILGYQDKNDKVYYIEENFIKTNLEPRELLIKVENHKIAKNVAENYHTYEYNEYSAHCGKIYWNTGDTVVFKREHSNKFIQIPANKIFEYQGDKITCKIVKVNEETKKIANIMKNSPFKLLEYKQ